MDEKKVVEKSADEVMLEKIERATARMEAANKQFEKNKALEESRRIDAVLDGNAEAGQEGKKKVESDADYAARVMAGDV